MNTNDQQRLNESIQRLYEQEEPSSVINRSEGEPVQGRALADINWRMYNDIYQAKIDARSRELGQSSVDGDHSGGQNAHGYEWHPGGFRNSNIMPNGTYVGQREFRNGKTYYWNGYQWFLEDMHPDEDAPWYDGYDNDWAF